MTIQITAKQAPELLLDVLSAGLVPMLVSSPGIGKSSIAKQISDAENLKLIDIRLSQCDPCDLNGFPSVNGERSRYLPMDTFPLEGDKIPEGYSGWLVLFDEANSAPLSVQAAAYKIILDRQIGQFNLHKNVAMMAAGNLAGDRAIVTRLSTAMQSRMIHFELAEDIDSWLTWADKADIDYRIRSFLRFQPDSLLKFDPDHNDKTFASPRTWEFLSKIISPWSKINITKLPILAGTISEGMAREFFGYSQIFEKLPTIEEIIAYPERTTIPSQPDIKYAITGLVSKHLSCDNADKIILFVNRLPIEFQIICLRTAFVRDSKLLQNKEIQKWISINAQELM
jgi:hypothetical protein